MDTFKRLLGIKHKMLKERENNFIKNGSLLQEEFIAFCNGKSLPVRVFSGKEVMKMSDFTDHQILHQDAYFQLYKGVIEVDNRAVCIKRFHCAWEYVGETGFVREIVLATQMGLHKNVLKLTGCCLETDMPILVYEFPDQGCLADRLYRQALGRDSKGQEQSLPWKSRLRIASEVSYALAYLQNGFSRPVIHRNFDARDVFLDKDFVAKLTGFYFSVSIPEGQDHVDDAVVGTRGYGAPEYISSGRLTEKSDVYLFGILLFELLACRSSRYEKGQYLRNRFIQNAQNHSQDVGVDSIVHLAIYKEAEETGQKKQLQEVYDLALRCTAREDDRPRMVNV